MWFTGSVICSVHLLLILFVNRCSLLFLAPVDEAEGYLCVTCGCICLTYMYLLLSPFPVMYTISQLRHFTEEFIHFSIHLPFRFVLFSFFFNFIDQFLLSFVPTFVGFFVNVLCNEIKFFYLFMKSMVSLFMLLLTVNFCPIPDVSRVLDEVKYQYLAPSSCEAHLPFPPSPHKTSQNCFRRSIQTA